MVGRKLTKAEKDRLWQGFRYKYLHEFMPFLDKFELDDDPNWEQLKAFVKHRAKDMYNQRDILDKIAELESK